MVQMPHLFHMEIKLEPQEFLNAWRPETSRLVLTAPKIPKLRERAAIRIAVGRPPVTATVLGTAVSVSPGEAGRSFLELAPDRENMSGIRLLLSAARGEPVLYLDRPLRWLARLPVVVASAAGAIFMNTFSISDRGCGLAWSGPPPTLGQGLALKFGAGPQSVELRGVICWTSQRGSSASAGVLFSNARSAPGAWSLILSELTRTGAPRV